MSSSTGAGKKDSYYQDVAAFHSLPEIERPRRRDPRHRSSDPSNLVGETRIVDPSVAPPSHSVFSVPAALTEKPKYEEMFILDTLRGDGYDIGGAAALFPVPSLEQNHVLLLRHQLFLACWEQENVGITMGSSLLLSLLLHLAGLLLQWAWDFMLSVPVLKRRGGKLWLKKDVSLCTEDRIATHPGYTPYLLVLYAWIPLYVAFAMFVTFHVLYLHVLFVRPIG